MRSGKELISASKSFAQENRLRSWFELLFTIFLAAGSLVISFWNIPLPLRIVASMITGLLYVRLFVIYHDYQHLAILQHSKPAELIFTFIGIYLLAPKNIWKRSHDHHHNNNSKLTLSGIGSYPTVSKSRYLSLSSKEKKIYLINRHPLTILFGYITLFIYWLNVKSFIQSPSKHMDSLVSLFLHITTSVCIAIYLGTIAYLVSWTIPFFIAFGMGSYLFYCQHNFPGATFSEHDWKYDHAALESTSFMVMGPVLQWFTGNIGYHHVHHLNSRIPFYRLKETMMAMEELQRAKITSWEPMEIARCFSLKMWDPELNKMITMRQLRRTHLNPAHQPGQI